MRASPARGRPAAAVEEARERGRVGREVAVHGDLGEQRPEHLQDGLRQQEHQRNGDPQAVGAHVAQQAAHQARVVGFAEDLFFHSLQSTWGYGDSPGETLGRTGIIANGSAISTPVVERSPEAPVPLAAVLWFAALVIVGYIPVLQRLVHQWAYDEDMGHGFFVPVIADSSCGSARTSYWRWTSSLTPGVCC